MFKKDSDHMKANAIMNYEAPGVFKPEGFVIAQAS